MERSQELGSWVGAELGRTERASTFHQVDPALFVNPPDDPSFATAARTALAAGARTPEMLQFALRTDYPLAVVRRRDISAELLVVWYVYRDGHWIPRRAARRDSR